MNKTSPKSGELISPHDVALMVYEATDKYGGKRAAAKRWKVSLQMVYHVINGHRSPTAEMLKDLRLEEIPVAPVEKMYRRK